MSGRHFTIEDRVLILQGVVSDYSIRKIAKIVHAAPSSVSRELQKHRILSDRSVWRSKTAECARVMKAPWICDGCPKISSCHNRKYRYKPQLAQKAYEEELHSCRQKIRTGSEGLKYIDRLITPLIRENHQTIGHIYSTHGEELGISRSTCYRYIDQGRLTVRNCDLPSRVRYRPKKKKKDKDPNAAIKAHKCRENRDYVAFLAFVKDHPKASVVEMDTVIGKNSTGGKVLLTLHFRKSNFMLAFLRDDNSARSVLDIFSRLYKDLGAAVFMTLFCIVLTDNGSEFKWADDLEKGLGRVKRCHIFYCDSRASQQKGKCEKNHEYIRKFLPQGTSFDDLTQKDVNLMMSHINSVRRDSLGGKSPFECLSRREMIAMKKLGLKPISPDRVILGPSLFRK